jgi:hypothetical protein
MKRVLIAAALGALVSGSAYAGVIPYPNVGSYNPVTYSFTATSSGEIDAYFAGSGASFDNELGLLVNGVSTGIVGLDDHTSSIGQELDLGPVVAGDTLTFVLQNNSLGEDAYSNPALNLGYDSGPADGTLNGHNHIYSTSYDSSSNLFAGVPSGVYVAFEDLPFPGADYNYFDETYVFTDVSVTSSIPEPKTWALLLLGVGAVGGALRRSRRQPAAVAA